MRESEWNDVGSGAAELLRCPVHEVERIPGAGNNEMFRIDTLRGRFALKRYIALDDDCRDRIGHEYGALLLLADVGETAVPQPIAADRGARIAIYEWIDGVPAERLLPGEIEAALAFLQRLHAYRLKPDALRTPLSVEACVDSGALRAQIVRRLDALLAAGAADQRLDVFLHRHVLPAWRELERRIGVTERVSRSLQTLSPSDFGAHNMIRRADGRLAFVDFEYFGWDDPVKLVADVVWHPGSGLGPADRTRFIAGAQELFGADVNYAQRFVRLAPLYGLRWALIVLAEFIPERWERRRRAGERGDWDIVKARQLVKAAEFIERSLQLMHRTGEDLKAPFATRL